jgi:Flp pilus assembly protein TadD
MWEQLKASLEPFDDPVNKRAFQLAAHALEIDDDDPAAAIRTLHGAVALRPDVAFFRGMLGCILLTGAWPVDTELAEARLAEARDELAAAVERDPENPLWRVSFGLAILVGGSTADGLVELERAVAVHPSAPFVHLSMGGGQLLAGKPHAAVNSLRTAIHLDPSLPLAHGWLAVALWQLGRKSDAIGAARDAILKEPTNTEAQANLCGFLAQTGDVAGAFAACLSALEMSPTCHLARMNLGLVYAQKGQYSDALRELREAANIDPKDLRTQYNLAWVLLRAGQSGGATAEYRKIVAQNPAEQSAYNRLGLLALLSGETKEAAQQLRKSLAIDDTQVDTHIWAGLALLLQGDVEGASTEFHRAIDLDPASASAHYSLARAYSHSGQLDLALVALRTAFGIDAQLQRFAETDNLLGKLRYDDRFWPLVRSSYSLYGPNNDQSAKVPIFVDDAAAVLRRIETSATSVRDVQCQVRYATNDPINLSRTERIGTCRALRMDPNLLFLFEFAHVVADGVLGKREWYLFDGAWLAVGVERIKQVTRTELCSTGEMVDLFREGVSPLPITPSGWAEYVGRRFYVERQDALPVDARQTCIVLSPRPTTPHARTCQSIEMCVADDTGLVSRIVVRRPSGFVETTDFIGLSQASINTGLTPGDFAAPSEWMDYQVVVEPAR